MPDVIHKYGPLLHASQGTLDVPGIPLHVGIQDHKIFVWARPDKRGGAKMAYVATGEEFTGNYVSTVIDREGYVWHAIILEWTNVE